MCPGDTLVFTCIVNDTPDAIVAWRRNEMTVLMELNEVTPLLPDFALNITYYNATSRELVTTATSQSAASIQLNGTTIACSPDGKDYASKTINIAGMYLIITWDIIN